jgi:hypothetical protein
VPPLRVQDRRAVADVAEAKQIAAREGVELEVS